jgi:hypothetical protein
MKIMLGAIPVAKWSVGRYAPCHGQERLGRRLGVL